MMHAYPYAPEFENVGVHAGMWGWYQKLKAGINENLVTVLKAHPAASFVALTGHSSGAGVALLLGFDLARGALNESLAGTHLLDVHTFGCPRVGDSSWVAALAEKQVTHVRVTHYKDPVPHLPPWSDVIGYQHSPQEVSRTK